MKLPRPYIPLEVRIAVIERQAGVSERWKGWARAPDVPFTKNAYLSFMLLQVFKGANVQLDHNPALCNREVIYDRSGKFVRYIPDANNPDFLIYRTNDAHDIKTRIRGDGAQYSDLALRRKFKRIEKRRKLKKR